jgi:hypothetical protein
MAEAFTVIFDLQGAGSAGVPEKWEQSEQAHPVKHYGAPVEIGRIVEVEAETAQEAVTGVRRHYGEAQCAGQMKVAKASSVETKTA